MEIKIYRKPLSGERDCKVFYWKATEKTENIEEAYDTTLDLATDLLSIAISGIEDIHMMKKNGEWVSMREECRLASLESGDPFDEIWEQSIEELIHTAISSYQMESVTV